MKNRNDFILMILLPAFAMTLSLLGQLNLFVSTLLILGLPALWLTIRSKARTIRKVALFSVIFSFPVSLISDYIAVTNLAWFVPHTVLPFRFFGVIPLEGFLWSALFMYFVILFYEHFFDRGENRLFGKNMVWLIRLLFVALFVFSVLLFRNPDALRIPYAFALWNVPFILPFIVILGFYRKLIPKIVLVGVYFFLFWIPYDLVSLHLNHWNFPGEQFIGWINFFGFVIPFEELLYFIFVAPALLAYYEFFDDDRK